MKFLYVSLLFISIHLFSQTIDDKKAPNSYIYDINLANSQNYSGIKIPVKKAFEVWKSSEFFKVSNTNAPIPAGVLSASVYWEDVPGLITNVSIEQGTTPETSKIAVNINNGKGKGNAVIAFKVDNQIYWSWHIWVTDNPVNGVNYQHGFESNFDDVLATITYMDRNLGAVSNHFLGSDWQKSTGLMYEWGRKDPFPPLVNKDSYFYELHGEVGNIKHPSISPSNSIPVVTRPSDDIGENMRYAVKNPLNYIINTDNTGNWFSNQRYKVPGTDFISWDLWGDNAEGGNSNANSSSLVLKKESRTYELKSELDPCPNGWRVPSYYGRVTQNNNLSFFGRKGNWSNDDTTSFSIILPTAINSTLDGVKVYPGLGMDFTNAAAGNRNIGIIPVSGGFVAYPNSVAPTAAIGSLYQDNNANGVLWSATFGYDGARGFSMISDPLRTNTTVGLNAIYNNQTFPTKSGNAVRCIRDVNMLKIGDFVTEYILSNKSNYEYGLDNPNTYIVTGSDVVEIPVNKAYSVYNQLLTDHQDLDAYDLVAKVFWTTNPNLIRNIDLKIEQDPRKSKIVVYTNEEAFGSAVISLHNKSTDREALWSWMIWAPEVNPTKNSIIYTTENTIATNGNFVNPTISKLPPLSTEFMYLNLGAEKPLQNNTSSSEITKTKGHHFQWGRKDAMPIFPHDENGNPGVIYLGSENSSANHIFNYQEINEDEYRKFFTKNYSSYESTQSSKHLKISDHIKYAVENPLTFMYQESSGEVYNGGTHVNNLDGVNDWVLNERNQAPERWGHANKKSPYDPCPEGWRVPDVSTTQLYEGSKGNSPWYNSYKNDAYGKPGVIQDQWHLISNFYNGISNANGYFLDNPLYYVGNFPEQGIRGELGMNEITQQRTGIWTASLADRATGFALAMQFQENKMQTGTGVYPQAGMGVRCAKDLPRYLGISVNKNAQSKGEVQKIATEVVIKNSEIFPSTREGIFQISNLQAKSYEIFDMSGRLVQSGIIKDKMVDASQLISGNYLLHIILDNKKVISQKILKK